jgi:toxin ParE1/3/4
MRNFRLTNEAVCDLKEIGRYTQNHWGQEQRNRYLALLDVAFHQLASNPGKGKDCSNVKNGYRKLNVGSHIVFYRQINSGMIEICTVAWTQQRNFQFKGS